MIKLENVGIKDTETTVASPKRISKNKDNIRPAATDRGIFFDNLFTIPTSSSCIKREMKNMNAKDGKNQKPEARVTKATARTMDV
jgi:hypothetical protein